MGEMPHDHKPSSLIPEEWLSDLAASGGICVHCGGVHVPNIDTALSAMTAARDTDVEIPYCSCDGCPVCERFRAAIATLARSSQTTEEVE